MRCEHEVSEKKIFLPLLWYIFDSMCNYVLALCVSLRAWTMSKSLPCKLSRHRREPFSQNISILPCFEGAR